jgi:hypothetical protein
MMKRKILTISLTLILMLAFASPAFAQGPTGAKVIFGDNFTLESEKTLDDDLVVFGGNVKLENGSKVTGDLVVFGGNVTIDGTVAGDIGLIGGNINAGETAIIEGDIGLVGGHANIDESAVVKGEIQSITEFDYNYGRERQRGDDSFSVVPPVPPVPDIPGSFRGPNIFGWISDVVRDIFWNISLVITLGLIGWLVAAFMPEQMMIVRRAVTESTLMSFGFGMMTTIVSLIFVPIALVLLITICLAIFPIIGYTLAGVALLFGWIVVGQVIGERLLSANGRPMPGFIVSTLIGVTVLTLVTNMPVIGQVPFVGFLLSLIGSMVGLVIAITGLGAVLLTRFGTRSYPAPAYAIAGGPSAYPSTGSSLRWTEPAPGVSTEAPTSSEAELNAKIKAALAEADEAAQKPDDEPEDEPEPEA